MGVSEHHAVEEVEGREGVWASVVDPPREHEVSASEKHGSLRGTLHYILRFGLYTLDIVRIDIFSGERQGRDFCIQILFFFIRQGLMQFFVCVTISQLLERGVRARFGCCPLERVLCSSWNGVQRDSFCHLFGFNYCSRSLGCFSREGE